LAGLALALVFRKETEPTTFAEPLEPLVRRGPTSPIVMEIAPPSPRTEPTSATKDQASEVQPPSASELFARNPAAPRIAERYPGAAIDEVASVAPFAPPAADAVEPIDHKIVDGDTLALLAKKYLGDAARSPEIFEANRQVLSDPELLPIGARLRIPRR
jgi:nucleoid-associated protein YgaU